MSNTRDAIRPLCGISSPIGLSTNKNLNASGLNRNPVQYFDEIFTANGRVRSHYADAYGLWASLSSQERKALHARSKQLFGGDYHQDPFPRVLTETEFQFLRGGVEQRARAILAFLHNYCTNGQRWKRVMPEAVLSSIIHRHHRENLLRNIDPERIAFPYGPDIIRDPAGRWKIVEDSAGIIGGLGDLLHGHRVLYRLMPEFRGILRKNSVINDPLNFYGELARYFSEKAREHDGEPLLYFRAFQDEPDQETRRLAHAFAQVGIESTTDSNHLRRVITKEGKRGGIFLRTKNGAKRIGALLFREAPEQVGNRGLRLAVRNPHAWSPKLRMRRLCRALTQSFGISPLQSALLRGQAWTNFCPGIQFVNDKVFGLYVDEMIRCLLRETPLLESITAKALGVRAGNGSWRADRGLLTALRRDRGRYVVKRVDEDGGSGVWIGRKESRHSLEKLIAGLREEPEKFIVQEFRHLSVLDNRIVDLRLHAHVDGERILVSNTPWGRANWVRGNGKVNIGSKGFTSPVVVVRDK